MKPRLTYVESRDIEELIREWPGHKAWFDFIGQRVGPNARLPAAPVEAFLARPAAWAARRRLRATPATPADISRTARIIPEAVKSLGGEVSDAVFIAVMCRPLGGVVVPPHDLSEWVALCEAAGLYRVSGERTDRDMISVGGGLVSRMKVGGR